MAGRRDRQQSKRSTDTGARRGLTTEFAVAVLAAVLGFSAVYATIGRSGKPQAEAVPPPGPKAAADAAGAAQIPTAPSVSAAAETAKLNTGQMTAFVFKKAPEPLPEITFTDGAGKPMTLADFRGRTVLLNLWATWCPPCRKEMPDLDRLQQELGSDRFQVLALSVDRQGVETARKFLDGINVRHLTLYIDPTARAATTLKAVGMPTTILIDAEGREIGRLVGPAEWHSADAKRLIGASMK